MEQLDSSPGTGPWKHLHIRFWLAIGLVLTGLAAIVVLLVISAGQAVERTLAERGAERQLEIGLRALETRDADTRETANRAAAYLGELSVPGSGRFIVLDDPADAAGGVWAALSEPDAAASLERLLTREIDRLSLRIEVEGASGQFVATGPERADFLVGSFVPDQPVLSTPSVIAGLVMAAGLAFLTLFAMAVLSARLVIRPLSEIATELGVPRGKAAHPLDHVTLRSLIDLVARIADAARARRELVQWQTLLRGLPFPVVVTRPESGQVVAVNEAFEEQIGHTEAGEVHDTDALWQRLFPDAEERAQAHAAWEALLAEADRSGRHQVGPVEARLTDARGARRTFITVANDVGGLRLLVFSDVTELRRLRHEAREADRMKGQVLSAVSHDLRTPLHAIDGLARELAEPGLPASERARCARLIQDSARNLTALVELLVETSRSGAQAPPLKTERFDLHALLTHNAELLRPRAAEKGVALEASVAERVPRAFTGDPVRLHQIVGNILGNAVKFTTDGVVRLQADFQEDTGLCIRVSDTGPGIDGPDQARIFDAYARAAPVDDDSAQGFGLGLRVARDLAESMGGAIEVDSRLGEGTAFTIHLPLPPAGDAGSTAEGRGGGVTGPDGPFASEEEPYAGLSALVAEDDEAAATLLRLVLRKVGIHAGRARTGVEALEVWRSQRPDVVFMDVEMPDLDGADAVARIREEEGRARGGKETFICALSGHTDTGVAGRLLERGCDAYRAKPLGVEEVREVLDLAAGRASDRAAVSGPG